MKKKANGRTKQIHGSFDSTAWEFTHHIVPPMTASTAFRLDSLERGAQGFLSFGQGNKKQKPIWIYDRLEEPTTLLLEEQLADMEGGEIAVSFGSGMGAISTAIMSFMGAGDRIVAHRTLYGCTYSLITNWLPKYGMNSKILDINTKELEKEIKDPKTKILYFESVSNPSLEIIDIERVVKLVKAENKKRKKDRQITIIVDNTFATPWALRPLEWGVDVVIQSLTKNIAGFGTETGGAIVTSKRHESLLKLARKDFGAMLAPNSAWHILVFGVSTQILRFEQQQQSAQAIAEFLSKHPKVEKVLYPGLKNYEQKKLAQKYLKNPNGEFSPGTMIAFTLKGNMKKCQKFVDDLATNAYSITLAVSLGMNKTLIEVPGFMTHSAIPADKRGESNLDPRLIRLSIGLEDKKDLLSDLKKSLEKI